MATTTAHAPTTSSTLALSERELGAWRGLLRVHAALTKVLDAELDAAHGLPLSSYEVLMHVADAPDGRMRMRDIASSILISRSGLTRLIDRLESDGLIDRASCPGDARGSFAVITPAGRAALGEARETHLAGVRARFLAHFGPEELEALAGYWERVLPNEAHAPGLTCG